MKRTKKLLFIEDKTTKTSVSYRTREKDYQELKLFTKDKTIANPASADIPDAPDVQYAVCAALSAKMTGKNAKNIVTYLKRLPQQEFAAFVIKDAMNRTDDLKRDLKADASIREWIMSVGKNLIL